MRLGTRHSIGNFNGNFEDLASLIRSSWGANQEQALDYDSEFLRSAFEYPGSSFDLAPAIYREGRLVAFIAGSPRRVVFAGRTLKLLNVSLLTVADDYKRRAYGPLVWRELMDRARAAGFDGTVNFCVEGDAMNRQMLSLAALCQQPTHRFFSISFMARLLGSEDIAPGNVTPQEPEVKIFMEAAKRLAEVVPFSRVWTQEEAEWQCHRRSGAVTYTSGEEHGGMLAGYAIKTMGTPMSCLMIDDIFWGDLTAAERIGLARGFLGRAAERGSRMAILPLLGYSDIAPFVSIGFRKIRRTLHMYLTLWNDVHVENPVTAAYIDVL